MRHDFDALSNASLRGPGAELDVGFQTPLTRRGLNCYSSQLSISTLESFNQGCGAGAGAGAAGAGLFCPEPEPEPEPREQFARSRSRSRLKRGAPAPKET